MRLFITGYINSTLSLRNVLRSMNYLQLNKRLIFESIDVEPPKLTEKKKEQNT